MAPPLPRGIPKAKASSPPLPPAEPGVEFTDGYGIVYVDGRAKITLSVDIKLSRNFQSCGIQAGMQFVTHADQAAASIEKGFQKLRDAVAPQISKASEQLDAL